MALYFSGGDPIPYIGLVPIDPQSSSKFLFSFTCKIFRINISDVTERLGRDSEGRSLSSNLVYTIWAVFGGFILHFLLCNYLTVLLRPSYEKPVDTTADLIQRDITPFHMPGGAFFKQMFNDSSNPNYKEISQKLVIAKDWEEYKNFYQLVTSTGRENKGMKILSH